MNITVDTHSQCANVLLDGPSRGDFQRLSSSVSAYVDDDALVALEIIDTTQFGKPFDLPAAERAVTWACDEVVTHS